MRAEQGTELLDLEVESLLVYWRSFQHSKGGDDRRVRAQWFVGNRYALIASFGPRAVELQPKHLAVVEVHRALVDFQRAALGASACFGGACESGSRALSPTSLSSSSQSLTR